jgi:RNA polymerase sigma-70 factor, ECF subfamily
MPSMSVPSSNERFANLLMGHQNRIVACIYAMVHNMDDTEEVFQQACVTMWEKFDTFQTDTDFAKWACSVAHLKAMSFLQRRRTSRVAFSEELVNELAESAASRQEAAEDRRLVALRACMERLSESDRQLLELRYTGTEKVADIAQQLGRLPHSISRSLARVRTWLLECVERTFSAESC